MNLAKTYHLIPLFIIIFYSYLTAAKFDRVDADLQKYDNALMQMKTDFLKNTIDPENVTWVTKKINHMYEIDQYMRLTAQDLPFKQQYTKEETKYFWNAFMPRWQYIDTTNTEAIKILMERYTWFWISKFGRASVKKPEILFNMPTMIVFFKSAF